jgi:ABC-type Fe3+ transport system permease subunit
MLESPLVVFIITFVLLWLSSQIGAYIRGIRGAPDEGERQDFSVILAASLTLLGLVIGFTFSMAVTRYDHRKNCEET